MKLFFLGTGNIFQLPPENYNSNILIYDNDNSPVFDNDKGNAVAFDCGSTFPQALKYFNIDIANIRRYYISHCHSDHCGGLEYVGFWNYFKNDMKSVAIYANYDVINELKQFLTPGLSYFNNKEFDISTIFNLVTINRKVHNMLHDIELESIFVPHMRAETKYMPSYGAIIRKIVWSCESVLITGDCKFDPQYMEKYYREVDLIIHDCDFGTYDDAVHSQYRFLRTLSKKYKKKMWLTHHAISDEKELEEKNIHVLNDGFLGLTYPGLEITLETKEKKYE